MLKHLVGTLVVLFSLTTPTIFGVEMIVASPKAQFFHCADAESFAILPSDYSRFTQLSGTDGQQFKEVLIQLDKPVLRLASMQRWDWRGEKESNALVSSEYFQEIRRAWKLAGSQKSINYHYLGATQYYDYAKANGILTVPMLDVRFFFDSSAGTVKRVPENLAVAAKQYAAGYAKFIKSGKYQIVFWEIGNEEYLSSYKFSPVEYAAVVKAYIDAVRQVDPSAKFGIQLATWLPEWKTWSEQVLKNLKGYENYINYANFHYYMLWYFMDVEVAKEMDFLRSHGFKNTKLAITEWRPTARANTDDQVFKSASSFSRYFMFMVRHPDIEMACVHAFPLFGGLAEWSDGTQWTSFSEKEDRQRRRDPVGTPRWRVLPFGFAQSMILDAINDSQIYAYSETVGGLSYYLFKKKLGGYSLVLINEGRFAVKEKISIESSGVLSYIQGKELFCDEPDALPRDIEPQPWQVKSISSPKGRSELSSGSSASLGNGNVVQVRLRPFSVVTLELK